MDTQLLDNKFAKIGARVKVAERPARRRQSSPAEVSLDVRSDRHGEFFEVARLPGSEAEVEVLDVQPGDRHLLLLVREGGDKNKFLCGHDERHWFVAGIPEKASVGTVRQAKEALKPAEVLRAQDRVRLGGKARAKRKNEAYVRQGEWFFLPQSHFEVHEGLILRNEPLRRSTGGKPHWAEFCYRTGGVRVYVSSRRPQGISEGEHHRLLSQNPKARNWGWTPMMRNPGVYARGRVRHADHATIMLHDWHRVVMNTEGESAAMRNVAFLD